MAAGLLVKIKRIRDKYCLSNLREAEAGADFNGGT